MFRCRITTTLAFLCLTAVCGAEIDPGRWEKEVLVPNARDVLAFDFGTNANIYLLERAGGVKKYDPSTRTTSLIGDVKARVAGDSGALGLALDPSFAVTGHLFIYYSPAKPSKTFRLSRFTVGAAGLDPASEVVLIETPLEIPEAPSHCGGGMVFDTKGNLIVGIGDNSPPQDVPAVHPTELAKDSRRSAANSQDLRGKILRIHPEPDGTYTIPAGNAFTDKTQGRPEIYAWGVRNPWRVDFDHLTGWITWGDVGGNVDTALGLGPEGYDELNLAASPGFYGWPFCSGPNDPWRPYDPVTKKEAGPFYDPEHLVNDSPHNTGLRELPPARPALLGYTAAAMPAWPALGSGGRSITGGPIFHRQTGPATTTQPPEELDRSLIFADWMRNWLMAARLTPEGKLIDLVPIAPATTFRKINQIKIRGSEIYLAEMGDSWVGNSDSTISRLTYNKGNRHPVVSITASPTAGRAPLSVQLTAAASDKDGDPLTLEWKIDGKKVSADKVTTQVFSTPGPHTVTLTATDTKSFQTTASTVITVGNAPPALSFAKPANGDFFEWGKPVHYELAATDAEDGALPPEKVLIQADQRDRFRPGDDTAGFPGLALMRAGTCFACHSTTEKSAGPPYIEVAKKYASDAAARPVLAKKIISGGTGVWGQLPMPPHPQQTEAQALQMIDYVLSLASRQTRTLPPGLSGDVTLSEPKRVWSQFPNGIMTLTASTVDAGTPDAPPLRAQAALTLRTRRQLACHFDDSSRAIRSHTLERGGMLARLLPDGWISFDAIPLGKVSSISLTGWPTSAKAPLIVEIHASAPDGPLLGRVEFPARNTNGKPDVLTTPIPPQEKPAPVFLVLKGPADTSLDLQWVEFHQ